MKHLSNMKENNKKNILKIIHKNKEISKKNIALSLGLSSSVITKLCNELKIEGIIQELKKSDSITVGRKEVLIGIKYDLKNIIGISINHNDTTIVLSDLEPKIIDKITFNTTLDQNSYLNTLINSLKELINKNNIKHNEILGIGISLKGITNGIASLSGIWAKPLDLKNFIENNLYMSVCIDNGVRCNALLENFNSGMKNFILLKYVKAGIGGAIMKDEELIYGDNNNIADLGHMIVDSGGEYCNICKRRGCLESIISYEKIIDLLKDDFSLESTPVLYEICNGNDENITMHNILIAAEQNSIKVSEILKKAASLFSLCLINSYAILDTKQIVLTGKIFHSKVFVEYLRFFIFDYQLDNLWDNIKISEVDNYSVAPLILVINNFFYR